MGISPYFRAVPGGSEEIKEKDFNFCGERLDPRCFPQSLTTPPIMDPANPKFAIHEAVREGNGMATVS